MSTILECFDLIGRIWNIHFKNLYTFHLNLNILQSTFSENSPDSECHSLPEHTHVKNQFFTIK